MSEDKSDNVTAVKDLGARTAQLLLVLLLPFAYTASRRDLLSCQLDTEIRCVNIAPYTDEQPN